MLFLDNPTNTVRDDLRKTIHKGSCVSIAAACFSVYAYQELKEQLEGVDELRFLFTSPTFLKEKAPKAKREFYIPRLNRERSIYGTEFKVKLRNELTLKAISRECADWVRRKVTFKSNTTQEQMPGFITVDESTYMPINGFTTVDLGCERGNNVYNFVTRTGASENSRQLLSGDVLEGDEAYEFTWVGKKAAMVEANKPTRQTLRPCPTESKNWDTTENLYIEGDNLQVLKLLQESYLGKVKMIYIDPPYNTGHDFIYNDHFEMDMEEYEQQTSMYDEDGNRNFTENTDSNPRFHSDWCSMMYSRLMLARNLLTEDGVIFISIDVKEQQNLRKMCDEIFGESDFITDFIWNSRKSVSNDAVVSLNHNYTLLYTKNMAAFYQKKASFKLPDSGEGVENPDNDIRGPWKADPFDSPGIWPNLTYGIVYGLIKQDYIDRRGTLTEKFFTERRNGSLQFASEAAGYEDSVLQILNSVYSDKAVTIEDARRNNIELQVDRDKLAMPQFKALWKRINAKSVYTVEFDSEELVRHCVEALDRHLNVRKIYFRVEEGEMNKIHSKEALESGEAFQRTDTGRYSAARRISVNNAVKYDLIGKLVEETGLTRHTVVQILTGIQKAVFDQFKDNPEEFILKAAQLINDEKATAIIQHITYHCLDDRYDTRIFTGPTIKGKLGDNAIKTRKHLYDYLVSDSQTERDFAQEMDAAREVAVYVKLPGGFYISTPVGRYNPDWAVAFYEGTVKHIYFVAETKGTMRSMQLRKIEESKIHCAREHFRSISGSDVVYDVVDSYETLLDLMRR